APRQLCAMAERDLPGLHRATSLAPRWAGPRILRRDGTKRIPARSGPSACRRAWTRDALRDRRRAFWNSARGAQRGERLAVFPNRSDSRTVDASGAGRSAMAVDDLSQPRTAVSVLTACPNGLSERREESAIPVFRGRRQLFRMPLDGDHPPGGIGWLERFN